MTGQLGEKHGGIGTDTGGGIPPGIFPYLFLGGSEGGGRGRLRNAATWIPVGVRAGWILVSPVVSDLDSFIDERAPALEQSITCTKRYKTSQACR